MDEFNRRSPIPEPYLSSIRNFTPHPHLQFDKMGPGRLFYDIVVVKGTFDITSGVPVPSATQDPIRLSDEVWEEDDPVHSSIKYPGDVLLFKPSTDLILTGHVHSPRSANLRHWPVGVRVDEGRRSVVNYLAHVTGPRFWRYQRGQWSLSESEFVEAVPIRYELAYGGAFGVQSRIEDERWVTHSPNPSGRGFLDISNLRREREYPAPQWLPTQDAAVDFCRDIEVAGFGPIARHWASRVIHAGTFDAEWVARADADRLSNLPVDYPIDFDARFFQCAHPSLICDRHLVGGEMVALTGVVKGREMFNFCLPSVRQRAALLRADGKVKWETMRLDTVVINVDSLVLHATWRLVLNQQLRVRGVVIEQENNI